MKRTQIDIDRLMGELELNVSQLGSTSKSNLKAQERIRSGAIDELDYAVLGYTIHNIYGIMENACLRIAKFFENGLSPTSWHKELLDRMRIMIPGIRPSFFLDEEFYLIDDLRGFRHVFRNLYGRPLDIDRLMLVQKKIPGALTAFGNAIGRYRIFLSELKGKLED